MTLQFPRRVYVVHVHVHTRHHQRRARARTKFVHISLRASSAAAPSIPFLLLFSQQHLFFPPFLRRARSFHPRSPRCFSLTLSRRRRRQRRRPCLQCPTTNSGHRREWPPLRRRRRRRRRRRPLPSSSSCRLSVTRRCRLNCRFPSKKSLPLLLALTLGAAVTFTSPTLE